MSRPIVRVVKIGGSLLDFADLPTELCKWRDAQRDGFNVFVAGGGALADAIRRMDNALQIGDVHAHWLCVRMMDVNARILSRLLNCEHITDFENLRQMQATSQGASSYVLAVQQFLKDVEPTCGGKQLPQDWSVTSDSIAARVAIALGADELVLLKSALTDAQSLSEAVRHGYVDEYFATAASRLPSIRCVNLRCPTFREMRFTC